MPEESALHVHRGPEDRLKDDLVVEAQQSKAFVDHATDLVMVVCEGSLCVCEVSIRTYRPQSRMNNKINLSRWTQSRDPAILVFPKLIATSHYA